MKRKIGVLIGIVSLSLTFWQAPIQAQQPISIRLGRKLRRSRSRRLRGIRLVPRLCRIRWLGRVDDRWLAGSYRLERWIWKDAR